MKVFHVKKQLAALFMPGFLIGIIYVNFLAKKYVAAPDLFSEYFLDQFRGVQIDEKEYLWYLLRIRCVPFFMLSGLALTKLKKVSAGLFLGWTGISVGVLVSLAASNLGMKGCLLCLIGVSPQFLFYIPAYFMILNYYRIICESCISEVVLELCVVVYRLCAAHIVYRSFAPFRR